MSATAGIYVFIWVGIIFLVLVGVRQPKWSRCDCSRVRLPWYGYRHRVGWLCGLAGVLDLLFVVTLLPVQDDTTISTGLHWFGVVFFTCMSVYGFMCWWMHDKDNLKRRLKRLAGRVIINPNGRLEVTA